MRILALILIAISILGCSSEPEQKFRIPAEWEEHQAVWVGWSTYDMEDNYVAANIIKELQPYVNVKVAFDNDSLKESALNLLDSIGVEHSKIQSHVFPGANVWMRDYGAIFANDTSQLLAFIDFGFNQYGKVDWSYERWPEYFEGIIDSVRLAVEHSPRSKVDSLMSITSQARYHKIDVILEGGAFEYNGNGVLIQTESVTLQRNPNKTKDDLEEEFRRFGIERVIWLPQGVIEDEHFEMLVDDKFMVGGTGGHTDEYVRFVDANTILLAWVDEDEIEEHGLNRANYERMNANYEILKKSTDVHGNPFKIIKMPMPRPVERPLTIVEGFGTMESSEVGIMSLQPGHNLSVGDTIQGVAAAGYLNFLVTNGLVLTATYAEYGSPDKDEEAKKILQEAFPDRKVIMLDALALNGLYGGGGIHCITMQEPKMK